MSVTAVVLSAQEDPSLEIPEQVHKLVYTSVIANHSELYAARLRALALVSTDTFYFQDDDDPVPQEFPEVANGLIYGDMWIHVDAITRSVPCWPYDARKHLDQRVTLHKAFCNTEQAQRIAALLPQGEYWTELMLYYFLANVYGWHYDRQLKMIWNRGTTGMHITALPVLAHTAMWIKQHQHEVIQKLK